MGANETTAAAEIVFNERGEVLWVGRYLLNRIHDAGETFITDGKEYLVIKSRVTFGAWGGALVEHVVRERVGLKGGEGE